MPTILPTRRSAPPPDQPGPPEREFRNMMVAAAVLLLALGLVCEKYFPATPGYSLARSVTDIQLSP
jgi:hypothetical protein